jgi:hypothetical protein
MSAATWTGENDPAAAIALAETAELPAVEIDAAVMAGLTHRERLLVAFGATGSLDIPRALAILTERGAPVDQSTAYQIRKALAPLSNGDGS